MQALFVLRSILDSWDELSMSLGNSIPKGVVSMQTVMNSPFREKTRRGSNVPSASKFEVMITSSRGGTRGRKSSFNKGRLK